MESQGAEAGGDLWVHLAQPGPSRATQSRVFSTTSIQLQRSTRRRPHSISSCCASTLPPAQHSSAARQSEATPVLHCVLFASYSDTGHTERSLALSSNMPSLQSFMSTDKISPEPPLS